MGLNEMIDCFERSPVIAAVQNTQLSEVLASPVEIVFNLRASLTNIGEWVTLVHNEEKKLFVHIDLAEGIGKDKTGIEFLAKLGVDGIISTKNQLIKFAKEAGLFTVQRFFALDSKGVDSILDILESTNPDLIEIMPAIASKVIKRFTDYGCPLIAGGLIETKEEITEALKNGATAVSTSKKSLWYL